MRKLIAGMNMSLDGFCDHTAMNADDEIHEHYNEVLRNADLLIYGRITYQLMEGYWPTVVKEPTGNKAIDDFGVLIDNIPKIVYSSTLKGVEWKNTQLKSEINRNEILDYKKQEGKNILVGSPGLIVAFANLDLVDEFHILVHPVIVGSGLTLFKNIKNRIDLKLLNTETFGCGAVGFYYETVKSRVHHAE